MDKMDALNKRNEAQDKIDAEHQKLCNIREEHGEESYEFKQQQSYFSFIQKTEGNEVSYLNEKLYGKQLKLFTAAIMISLASILSASGQVDTSYKWAEQDTTALYEAEPINEELYEGNLKILNSMVNGGYTVDGYETYEDLSDYFSKYCEVSFGSGDIKGKVLTAKVWLNSLLIQCGGETVGYILPKQDMMEKISSKDSESNSKDK